MPSAETQGLDRSKKTRIFAIIGEIRDEGPDQVSGLYAFWYPEGDRS